MSQTWQPTCSHCNQRLRLDSCWSFSLVAPDGFLAPARRRIIAPEREDERDRDDHREVGDRASEDGSGRAERRAAACLRVSLQLHHVRSKVVEIALVELPLAEARHLTGPGADRVGDEMAAPIL